MKTVIFPALILVSLASSGCDRVMQKSPKQLSEAAAEKLRIGDTAGAIRLYEASLDGTAETAETHYRLALIYDDKLKRPVDAMHHFKRYLELAPKGKFATEANEYGKEGGRRVVASLSEGTPMTQSEGVRLKKENLALRQLITELRASGAKPAVVKKKAKGDITGPLPPGAHTHLVQPGETLSAISRKYYKTRNRDRDILDANHNQLDGKTTIKPGQVLIIPK